MSENRTQMSQFNQIETISLSSISFFVLFRPTMEAMMPTGIGEGQLHSVYIFKSQSHPETPSQIHPRKFYQLSGHLFTQAGKYTKLTITRKHCEVAYSGS